MGIVKDLTVGQTLKVYEDSTAVEFIVAQHDYEKDLNGKGKALLMRTNLLPDNVGWGSKNADVSWENEPTLRNWLENTYAKRLSEAALKTIVPVTIRYSYGSNRSGTLKDQRFFIPTADEFNQFPGGKTFWERSFSGGRENATVNANGWDVYDIWHYSFACRNAKTGDDPSNSDNKNCWGYIEGVGVKRGKGADPGDPGHITTYWHTGYHDSSIAGALVCFCVDENATVDDKGALTSNKAPEIKSNYFGKDGLYGRWKGSGFLYKISDPEEETVTVTEKIDGVVHKTFTAIQNGVYRFELSDDMLNSFAQNAQHTLTVEATDGTTTTVKSCKVKRIRSPGYVVYIGQIKGTADGQSYYWTERNVLDDPYDEKAAFILDPELTLEANDICSFTFTVPVSNPYYDKLRLKKPVISVEEDGHEIFMGYITELSTNFNLDIDVTCVSELGYLQERQCQVKNQFYTVEELVKLALAVEDDPAEHSGFKAEGKVFLPGSITVEKPESDTDKETANVGDCWDVLTNNVVGKYGGYLRLHKEIKMVDGVRVYTRYLDCVAKLNDKTDQVIRLGDNLLDISYYLKDNGIVNSVKAIGWSSWKEGFLFWETTHTQQLTAEAYNGESIKKYGLCQKTITVEGTSSTTDSLYEKAKDELKKYGGSSFSGSLQINAADLADIGVDTDRLDFLKETYVLSEPHGIENWLPCVKEVIPLHELDEKDFTFGETTSKLSSLQAANFGTAGKAWNAIQSTIGYLNTK